MFIKEKVNENSKENYELILLQLVALLKDEKDTVANQANAAALLNVYLKDINWVGFYLLKDQQLVLGPFQGFPACTRIEIGKGVCGTAFKELKTMRIKNVHDFPGHIACDVNSQSEIVIVLYKDNKAVGVLDIDAPIINRFSIMDQEYLEKIANVIEKYCF